MKVLHMMVLKMRLKLKPPEVVTVMQREKSVPPTIWLEGTLEAAAAVDEMAAESSEELEIHAVCQAAVSTALQGQWVAFDSAWARAWAPAWAGAWAWVWVCR